MIITIGTMRLGFAVLEAQKNASRGLGDVTILPSVTGQKLTKDETQGCSNWPHVVRCIAISSYKASIQRDGEPVKASNVTGVPEDLDLSGYGFTSASVIPAASSGGALLPKQLAHDLSVVSGDTLEVSSPTGKKTLTVAGILDERETALTLGNSIFVSLDWVIANSGADRAAYTRMDVKLDGSLTSEEWIHAHGSLLPGNAQLIDPAEANQALEPLLMAVQLVLALATMGLAALALWLMIIAFQRALREQQETYATMNLLGASPRWLTRMIASQVGLFGIAAVSLGVIVAALGQPLVLSGFLQVNGASGMSVSVNPLDAGVGVLLGLALGFGAAYRPIRSINDNLKDQREQTPQNRMRISITRHVLVIVAMIIFLTLGVLAILLPRSIVNSFCAVLAIPLVLLAVPYVIQIISAAVHVRGGAPQLAMLNLRTSPTIRVSATLLALLVALGTMVLTAVSGASILMVSQVREQFGSDIQVNATTPRTDESIEQRLAKVSGVGTVSSMSIVNLTLQLTDSDVAVSARIIDPETYFETASFAVKGRSVSDIAAQLSAEHSCAILVPTGLAARYELREGSEVTIAYGTGRIKCTVAGRFAALATGTQIVIPERTGENLGIKETNAWNVSVNDDEETGETEDLVREIMKNQPDITVTSGQAMIEKAINEAAQYTNAPLFAVMAMAVMTAAATMSMLSLEVESRKPDYLTWFYLGASPSLLQRTLLLELVVSLGVGILVGCMIGIIGGQALTHAVGVLLGIELPLSVPITEMGLGVAGVIGVNLLTLIPALLGIRRIKEN